MGCPAGSRGSVFWYCEEHAALLDNWNNSVAGSPNCMTHEKFIENGTRVTETARGSNTASVVTACVVAAPVAVQPKAAEPAATIVKGTVSVSAIAFYLRVACIFTKYEIFLCICKTCRTCTGASSS